MVKEEASVEEASIERRVVETYISDVTLEKRLGWMYFFPRHQRSSTIFLKWFLNFTPTKAYRTGLRQQCR